MDDYGPVADRIKTPEIRRSHDWAEVKNPNCQCRKLKRGGFDPWVRKIPLEEEMAVHSSILAWKIPCTEESGRLRSVGSQRV